MSWDLNEGLNGTGNGGSGKNFAKFPVGLTRIRVLDAVPYMRWTHWLPQFSRSITCPGYGCPIDQINKTAKEKGVKQQPYQMTRKWALNVYNYDTQRIEIMEQGFNFMEDLKTVMEDLAEDGKKLADAKLKIRRRTETVNGKEKTTYRVDIDEKLPMEDEVVAVLDQKTDLREYFTPHTPEQIKMLLEVTSNHKEEFERIMSIGKEQEPTADEVFEVEE